MLAHTLWQLANQPATTRYYRALKNPAAEQAKILAGYLRRNAQTFYGRQHGFDTITSAAVYQRKVPITTYEDYRASIEKIAAGENNILTAEKVHYLAPTSGSSGPEKLIPYTASLLKEFNRAIGPWINNLFSVMPSLKHGPAYWSITPQMVREQRGKIPIGFEEDSAYLGRFSKGLVESTFAVPSAIRRVCDMETFRYLTLLALLRCRDLAIVSVWHPSFFALLLEGIPANWERLLHDIRHGTTMPRVGVGGLPPSLVRKREPNAPRAEELKVIGPAIPAEFWPKLALISCWADANAKIPAQQMASLFPSTRLQAKGLIATEAFTSLPLLVPGGAIHPLAITSHFFEFLTDAGEAILPQHGDANGIYTLLVTTAGGLYRYNTHDRIRITGRHEETPCIEFLGKEDHISDLFGEKLNAVFVTSVLEQLQKAYRFEARFLMLAPAEKRYALFIEAADALPSQLAETLDNLLSRNPHYQYCRALGQLDRPIVERVHGAHEKYLRACHRRGQQLGTIKPTALHRALDWAAIFRGQDIA